MKYPRLRTSHHLALVKWSVDGCLFQSCWGLVFSVSLCWELFLHDLCVIVVLFWCLLCNMLVSFWCPWGSFGDPGPSQGPLKGPSRTSYEQVCFLLLSGRPEGCLCGRIFYVFQCVPESFFRVAFCKASGVCGELLLPSKQWFCSNETIVFTFRPVPPKCLATASNGYLFDTLMGPKCRKGKSGKH